MKFEKILSSFGIAILIGSFAGCGLVNPEGVESDYGHMVGDFMASINDTLVSGGIITMNVAKRIATPQVLNTNFMGTREVRPLSTSCSDVALSSCTVVGSNQETVRDFAGCDFRGYTFEGSVTYDYPTGTDCKLDTNETVHRTPNYTMEGRRNYTMYVSGQSPAQTISRSGTNPSEFTFSSSEIDRTFVDTQGTVMFSFSSQTSSDITVTKGVSTLTLSGGEIELTNTTDGATDTCSITPTSVQWTGGCKCPTSGYWSGSCTGGNSLKITFSGCGGATIDYGDSSSQITLDRCF